MGEKMAEIDSLEIKIEADAQRASHAIDTLIDKLGRLDSALDLKHLGNISRAFAGISEKMKDTSGIDKMNAGMAEFADKSQAATQAVKKSMDSVQRKANETALQIRNLIRESTAVTKDQKSTGERFYLGNKDGVKGIDVMTAELLKLKDVFKGMTESDMNKALGGEGKDYTGVYNEVINKIKEIIYEFGHLDVAGDQTAKDIVAALKSISGIDMTGLKEEGHDMRVIREDIAQINKTAHNVVMTLNKSKASGAIFEDLHNNLIEIDSDFANIANRADVLELIKTKISGAKDQTLSFTDAVNAKKQSIADIANFIMEVSVALSRMSEEEVKSSSGFYKIATAINQMAGKSAPKIHELRDIYKNFMDEVTQKAFKLDTTQKESVGTYDFIKQSLSVISTSWDDMTEKAKRYADAIEYIRQRFEELVRGMNIGLPDKGVFGEGDKESTSLMMNPRPDVVDGKILDWMNVYEEKVDNTSASEERAKDTNISLLASFVALGHELEKVSQLFEKLSSRFTSTLKLMYTPLKAVVNEYKEKLEKIGGFFNKFKRKVQANLAKISAFWKRTMKTFTFMLVRKAITAVIGSINDATKSLALFSKEVGTAFNDNISSAIADFKWIAKSIVGAFEPIINYVVPILDRLSAALVKVMTLLGHFFAAMTGQGYYMVAKKKIEDYTGAIEDAEKAAKRAIRPFDELNLITTPNSSNVDAGGNPYEDWDMKPVSDKMKDFADKVKKILADLFEPMKKAWDRTKDYVISGFKYMMSELGKLAKAIGRDFIKVWKQEATVKMFENLLKIVGDLERVIGNLAKRFREAWEDGKNGFFIFENIRDIAATLVQHIRNVTRYMIDWSDSINFKPLLKSIEELTRSLVKVADFIGSVFYDVMVNVILKYIKWMAEDGLPHMLETLKEVVDAFDFEHIRRGLFIVEQAFESMLENVHTGVTNALGALGKSIAEWTNSKEFTQFMKAIAHIMEQFTSDRVQKVIEGLGLAILHIAESLAKFVSSDKFLNFIDKIGEWIDNHSAEDIAKIAEKIGVMAVSFKILGSVAGSLAGFIQTIAMFKAFGNIAKIASGFSKPTKEVAAFSNVLSGLVKTFPATAGLFKKMGAGLAKITSPLAGLGAKLKSGAGGIKAAATATGTTFAETFFYAVITAVAGYNIGKKLGELITGDKETYKNFKLFDFKDLFTGDPIADLKDMFNGLISMMTDFKNNPVVAGLANIVAGPILSIGVGIKTFIDSNPFAPLIEKIGEVKDSIFEKFEGIGEWFSGIWETITASFNEGVQIAIGFVIELKDSVIEKFSAIKQSAEEKFNAVKESIKTKMSEAKMATATKLEELRAKFNAFDLSTAGRNLVIKFLNGMKEGWSTVKSWASEAISNLRQRFSELKLNITTTFSGFRQRFSGHFASGGFPEDGWFRASHGEIMGQFDNGKSVVANNQQITDGITNAVTNGMAPYFSALINAVENSGANVTIEGDMNKLFRAMVKENGGANKRTFGNSPMYA